MRLAVATWRSSLIALCRRNHRRSHPDGARQPPCRRALSKRPGTPAHRYNVPPAVTILNSRQVEGHSRQGGAQRRRREHGADRRCDRRSLRFGARRRDRFRRLSRRRQPQDRGRLERAELSRRRRKAGRIVTLELTRDQVKAAPGIQGGQAGRRAGRIRRPGTVPIISPRGDWEFLSAEPSPRASADTPRTASGQATQADVDAGAGRTAGEPDAASVARAACAASTGSSSFSPTCRPDSARSSRSI